MTYLTRVALFQQPVAGLLWDEATLTALGLSKTTIYAPAADAGDRITIALAALANSNPKPVRFGAARFTGTFEGAGSDGLDLGDLDPMAFVALVTAEWNGFVQLGMDVLQTLAQKTKWVGKFVDMFQLGVNGSTKVFHIGLGKADSEAAEDENHNRLYLVHAYILVSAGSGEDSIDLLPVCAGAKTVKSLYLFRKGDTSPNGLPAGFQLLEIASLPGAKDDGVLDGLTAAADALAEAEVTGGNGDDSVVQLDPPIADDPEALAASIFNFNDPAAPPKPDEPAKKE